MTIPVGSVFEARPRCIMVFRVDGVDPMLVWFKCECGRFESAMGMPRELAAHMIGQHRPEFLQWEATW